MTPEQQRELLTYTNDWNMTHENRVLYIEQVWSMVEIGMDRYFDEFEEEKALKKKKLASNEEMIVGQSKGSLLEDFESTTKH